MKNLSYFPLYYLPHFFSICPCTGKYLILTFCHFTFRLLILSLYKVLLGHQNKYLQFLGGIFILSINMWYKINISDDEMGTMKSNFIVNKLIDLQDNISIKL